MMFEVCNNLIPTDSFVQVMKIAFQNPLVVPTQTRPEPSVQMVNSLTQLE